MKVLIDISSTYITNAGINKYVSELLSAYNRLGLPFDITEYSYKSFFPRNTKLRIIDSVYRDLVWPSTQLAMAASKKEVDMVHAPAFLYPLTTRKPVLSTIHDIYAFIKPEDFKFWHRNVSQYYIKAAINSGRFLLVQNEFTKQEVLRYFPKAKGEKIYVVYTGISEARVMNYDEQLNETILGSFGVSGPYLLSVSTIEPRKNFSNLIKAFSLLKDKVDHTLILVGKSGWKNAEIYALVQELGLQDRVHFTGFIPDDHLNNLYSHADCFVFPSFYEGFGLTPLEAMKGGSPVVSSNASCMPEVLGNAAIYFDPYSAEEIASTMYQMLSDKALQLKYKQLGLRQATRYNWDVTAKKTFEVYKNILGSNN